MKGLAAAFKLTLAFGLLFLSPCALGCSMCKVTVSGRTYLGSNEDSWRLGAKIWFEKSPSAKFGAVYVGYSDFFAQGGMNEAGLAFDGLTIYREKVKVDPSKKTVENFGEFVKHIMQNFETVEDVRRYAVQFNRQKISNGELFFADKMGNYLIMEPDTIIMGRDPKYVIANFCPSNTSDQEKLYWDRYRRGHDFIEKHNDATTNYCLAVVDTMHECRQKLGDGTMYSTIADLNNGDFSVYFYHDYQHEVKFSLKKELLKGDHAIDMVTLFPNNKEYEKLINYKTPQNSNSILLFLVGVGGVCICSATFFLFGYFRNNMPENQVRYKGINAAFFVISSAVLYYAFVLVRNQPIFYSPAPYRDYKFSMLNIAAYIPFILLILIFPFLRANLKVIRNATWKTAFAWVLTLNNLMYLTLIIFFFYWGFYDIL